MYNCKLLNLIHIVRKRVMYECQKISYMYNMHVFILGEQRWVPFLKYWEYNDC